MPRPPTMFISATTPPERSACFTAPSFLLLVQSNARTSYRALQYQSPSCHLLRLSRSPQCHLCLQWKSAWTEIACLSIPRRRISRFLPVFAWDLGSFAEQARGRIARPQHSARLCWSSRGRRRETMASSRGSFSSLARRPAQLALSMVVGKPSSHTLTNSSR